MRRGGLTAVNCTCAVWEGVRGAMDNIAQWKRWFDEDADIIIQVYNTDDIRRAKREGKTGISLGWQNSYAIEDRLEYLQLLKVLGVNTIQLTYNTRNLVGSGCWETEDTGLSDFGRDCIDEMNRLGMLVDLSHVGPKTRSDVIAHSKKPVAHTHCAPTALFDHPRNKSDAQLKEIADQGGFVGYATYPMFLACGADSKVEDCVDGIEHLINIIGEDSVGIGTDFTQDQDVAFFDYLSCDKGTGRRIVPPRPNGGVTVMPKGLRAIGNFPNLTKCMLDQRWSEARIRKVMGENWLRFLDQIWTSMRAMVPRGLPALMAKRDLSLVELCQALLDRIGRLDPTCHAFIESTPELVLAAARTAETEFAAGRVQSPMQGVPFGLKDIIDLAGFATTCH